MTKNANALTPLSAYPLPSLKKNHSLLAANRNRYAHRCTAIELFAGGGGFALGLERAGIDCALLTDADRFACQTLRNNRPGWNVVEGDIREMDFYAYRHRIDIVTGGFPCQAFSVAGKQQGLNDPRGQLCYEFVRAIDEIQPRLFVGENVRGLVSHDQGKTLQAICRALTAMGYDLLPPCVLKAIYYRVPQKRERLFIVGVRRGSDLNYEFPVPQLPVMTLRDALKQGRLYDTDVPVSQGHRFSAEKQRIIHHVTPGANWRSLSKALQKRYLKRAFYQPGSHSTYARRIAWDEPCLTLLCRPSETRMDRIHPDEPRPFTVRECARIQTFPDDWVFSGSVTAQYRQIGNAVPVNLAAAIGESIIRCFQRGAGNTTR